MHRSNSAQESSLSIPSPRDCAPYCDNRVFDRSNIIEAIRKDLKYLFQCHLSHVMMHSILFIESFPSCTALSRISKYLLCRSQKQIEAHQQCVLPLLIYSIIVLPLQCPQWQGLRQTQICQDANLKCMVVQKSQGCPVCMIKMQDARVFLDLLFLPFLNKVLASIVLIFIIENGNSIFSDNSTFEIVSFYRSDAVTIYGMHLKHCLKVD
ncbi:hypothetical protein FGO68_gene15052 [Halteria grandinella]|uniref:Uncharacterized protein n=1 Tax=Halteria grandinella TaxID=5974 RepID=A0A8J8NML6_HALGN|nr:hypothetical protein FGO68_gene15052 [Halteria grandinella]